MKIKQLVLATIIALILANVVITFQYKKDLKEYERQVEFQSNISKSRQTMINEKNAKIDVLREVIQDNKKQIHSLKQQLEKAQKRNESPSVSRGESINKAIYMVATAYVSHCYGCSGITKVGIDVRNTIEHNGMKIIAVDPNVIPLHSIVRVNTKDGNFLAYAADTGGRIKNFKIDLLIDIHNEQKAFDFGIQNVTVQIIREGKE